MQTISERAVHIDDRISKVFVIAIAVIFGLIFLNALFLGKGGLFAPVATPAPIPVATAAPSATPAPSRGARRVGSAVRHARVRRLRGTVRDAATSRDRASPRRPRPRSVGSDRGAIRSASPATSPSRRAERSAGAPSIGVPRPRRRGVSSTA